MLEFGFQMTFRTATVTLVGHCLQRKIIRNHSFLSLKGIMCVLDFFLILRINRCLECCMLLCVMCVTVLYCTVLYLLYCPVLHCSTLPPGINPFAVNNNNNNKNSKSGGSLVSQYQVVRTAFCTTQRLGA
jgi:hypothetical protein